MTPCFIIHFVIISSQSRFFNAETILGNYFGWQSPQQVTNAGQLHGKLRGHSLGLLRP